MNVILAASPLDPIYTALGSALAFFYSLVPSYGFAIIMLTLSVRVILIPLTAKQLKSQQAMQRLQPELKKLQAKYKDDRQTLNEEMMKLYKEHKANPLAGCLPLLLQMPLFIVLYRLILSLSKVPPKHIPVGSSLYKSVVASGGQLKSFGINLATKPGSVPGGLVKALPYFVLVGLVVATGYYQQRQMAGRMPKDGVNNQMQAVMKVFPLFFGVISLSVPAGVVVYFFMSNLWQIGQQAVAFRNIPPPEPAAGAGGGGHAGAAGGGKPAPKGLGLGSGGIGGLVQQAKSWLVGSEDAGTTKDGSSRSSNGRPGSSRPTKGGTPTKGQSKGGQSKGGQSARGGTASKGRAGQQGKGQAAKSGPPAKSKGAQPAKGGQSAKAGGMAKGGSTANGGGTANGKSGNGKSGSGKPGAVGGGSPKGTSTNGGTRAGAAADGGRAAKAQPKPDPGKAQSGNSQSGNSQSGNSQSGNSQPSKPQPGKGGGARYRRGPKGTRPPPSPRPKGLPPTTGSSGG